MLRFPYPIAVLLLGSMVLAAPKDGPGPVFQPLPFQGGEPPASDGMLREAAERLARDAGKFDEIQAKFGLQAVPEAAPYLAAIRNLIDQGRQALASGNAAAAMAVCGTLEYRITELGKFGGRNSMDRLRSGSDGGFDSSRLRQDQQAGAEFAIQGVADRLGYLAQRLEAGKNPQAASLIEKVRAVIEAARGEAEQGRFFNVPIVLAQADPLLNELQRLQQAMAETDPRAASGPSPDPFKNAQPSAAAQAEAQYQRVYNAALRLGERPSESGNPKAGALRTRVFDLLEKAKEALATGQTEAAKGYCLKAESVLAEWHRSLSDGGKLSTAARERVKAKLDLAGDIVSAAKNEKAARILEKARDHFERAERGRAEGRTALADVEMDLALKLAAKAVDIARYGSR